MQGEVIQSNVAAVHPFGTIVRIGEGSALVHMTDQSWYWPYNPYRHWCVGQACQVWVGPVMRNGREITVASFRLVYPEHDPAQRFAVGDIIEGRVARCDPEGLTVSFGPAQEVDFSVATLARQRARWTSIAAGAGYRARIAQINEGPVISLDPVGEP